MSSGGWTRMVARQTSCYFPDPHPHLIPTLHSRESCNSVLVVVMVVNVDVGDDTHCMYSIIIRVVMVVTLMHCCWQVCRAAGVDGHEPWYGKERLSRWDGTQ